MGLQKRDSTNLMDLLCFFFLFARCNSLHSPVRPRPSLLYCTHRSMGLDSSLNISILRIYFPPYFCVLCAGDHSVMNVIYQLRRITSTWAPRINRDAKISCKQRRFEAYVPARRRRNTVGRNFSGRNMWYFSDRQFLCRLNLWWAGFLLPLSVLCSLRFVLTEDCLCEEWKLPPQWHYMNSLVQINVFREVNFVHFSMFHRAYFNSITDKTPTHALFIQHYIGLACWFH